MNSLGYSKFGMILAAQARVMGMVAENQQREALGQSMTYVSHDFNVEAQTMEDLSREIAEHGWRPE